MQTIKSFTRKPSKQRKQVYQAPDHLRWKLFASPLSPELRNTYKAKNLPVRSGDTVRIIRGDHKGFEGKVTRVDRGDYRIYVEGLTREKVDGTTVFVPTHPSKVMITKLNLDDKWRKQILERKKSALRKVEEAVEKPPEKPAKEVVEPEKKALVEKPSEKPKRRTKTVAKKAKKVAEKEGEKEETAKKTRVQRKPAKKKTEGEK